MGRWRGKLPVLAEIARPPGEGRWGIRERDFEALARPLAALDGSGDLLVTGGGEEQRVAAIALAAAAAAGGRRTILVECDVGQPRLAAELGLAASPGLHEYLLREATAAELLQPVVLAGTAAASEEPLVCVAAGRAADDPAALLGLAGFREMTAKLRDAYQLRVLVGPPLGNAEAGLASVAAEAEAVLLALPPDYARGERARTVGAVARRLGPRPLGAVLVGDT